MGVGMPATIKLHQFGAVVRDAFGEVPYHVGSSVKAKTGWRDVDVRLILSDEDFARIVGELTVPRCLNARWNALCLAFAALGREMTGLPVDFQIDQQTDANERYGSKPRSALILTDMAA